MANRRRVQRRKPRTTQYAEPCISIINGKASIFEPKKKQPRTHLENKNGKWIIVTKERALY